MIELNNPKLLKWISEKDAIVMSGRKISKDIEDIDLKIKRFETMEKRITGKVIPPKELTDKGDAMAKQMGTMQEELIKMADAINQSKLEAIPAKMKADHLALMKEKEHCERERNKLALKVQKIKDRIIPLVQKEVKPLLPTEFDDIETAKIKDGKVVIETFNHLEEFRKKFKK